VQSEERAKLEASRCESLELELKGALQESQDLHRQLQNQIQLVGTNYGGMVAFQMAEMYPNFVKKVMISSSGVGFVSTSLDELLARSNLSSISELMLPSSVKGMKVFLANVTYKAMWLLNLEKLGCPILCFTL
jgi:pimeloyl-ACP methyl ester carboxylesterase